LKSCWIIFEIQTAFPLRQISFRILNSAFASRHGQFIKGFLDDVSQALTQRRKGAENFNWEMTVKPLRKTGAAFSIVQKKLASAR
jgi:hypothetical protein